MDRFTGLEVTVTKIDRCGYGSGTLYVECVLEQDPPVPIREVVEIKKGHVFRCSSDCLDPIDTSMVPETHNKSQLLRRIWVMHEASCDAWFRTPPADLAAFKEEYGKDWKDERIWEMEKK